MVYASLPGIVINSWSHVRENGKYSEEFGLGVVCIKALSLSHCSSSWCWKRFHMSFALPCHWNFPMLITWCSSQTSSRTVPSSSRRGRLSWKVNGSKSTWIRSSSWSMALALMSLRNPTITPVRGRQQLGWMLAVQCESTRGAVGSLIDW